MAMANDGRAERRPDENWKYAQRAMAWYGWGSPIGAGVFLVCVAAAIAILRYAILG